MPANVILRLTAAFDTPRPADLPGCDAFRRRLQVRRAARELTVDASAIEGRRCDERHTRDKSPFDRLARLAARRYCRAMMRIDII